MPRVLLLLGEEGGRVLGRLDLLTLVLAHELVDEGVGGRRREVRIATPERHLDEARVADHVDLQPVEKSARQLTAPVPEVVKLGMMFEPQEVDDPVGESAALEQSLEGLELSLR